MYVMHFLSLFQTSLMDNLDYPADMTWAQSSKINEWKNWEIASDCREPIHCFQTCRRVTHKRKEPQGSAQWNVAYWKVRRVCWQIDVHSAELKLGWTPRVPQRGECDVCRICPREEPNSSRWLFLLYVIRPSDQSLMCSVVLSQKQLQMV